MATMVQNLQQGMKYGLRQGLNNLFTNNFPLDAGSWAARFPGITTPSSIWGCQEASGNLIDYIGGITLSASGTVTYRNIVDPLGRAAVGFPDAADRFAASSNATYDLDELTSLTLWVRAALTPTAAHTGFAGKRTTTPFNGYGLTLTVTNSYGQVTADPGAGTTVTTPVAVATDDSVFRDYLLVIDRGAAKLARFHSQLGTASADITSLATLANTGLFSLGAMTGANTIPAGSYISYAAVWYGTALTADNYTTLTTRT